MKYSENNKPIVCMMTQSTCYQGTRLMEPRGVLWHSTGANNPWLKRYVQPDDNAPNREEMLALIGKNQYNNDWNHIYREAGLNAWIGKLADGTIATLQVMPWNYRPWGCGSGSKGSCNNGWMQFEICEDGLDNKAYFDAVYEEACQLTAYYCKMYNLNPHGFVDYNGMAVPVILDHIGSYNYGLGGNHGDVQHWFKRYGKTLDDVRDRVAEIMDEPEEKKEETKPKEIFRVRKSWEDSMSQIGAYLELDNAIAQCDKVGSEYKVFNSIGEIVYFIEEKEPTPEPQPEPDPVPINPDDIQPDVDPAPIDEKWWVKALKIVVELFGKIFKK